MHVRALIALMCLTAMLASRPSVAQEYVCASDMTTACQTYAGGRLCPVQRQQCRVFSYRFGAYRSCPAGSQYPCINTGRGNYQCSPVQCVVKPQPVACNDGADNDGDGRTDYPNDPGCESATDTDETDPPPAAACRDGQDNDGDAKTDYPADPGCASNDDASEIDTTSSCTGQCVCAADLDNDGAADQPNEHAACDAYADGQLCPLQREQCNAVVEETTDPTTGRLVQTETQRCPSDSNAPCIRDGTGSYMCSRNPCLDASTMPRETHDIDQDFPEDDGPRDAQGNCLGALRIFPGAGKRCRKSGNQTMWQNCCDNDMQPLDDTMGERGGKNQREYREEESSIEFWKNQCDIQDQETSLLADSGYCIYLGTYCAEKWPLVGCVQKSKSYCCYNSKLARIIQQQGRPQIPGMGGFGSAKQPNCRGFSPEEFQTLDFSKIDLTEYYASVRHASQSMMEQQGRDAARQDFGSQ